MLSTLGKEGLAEYHKCPDGKNRYVALMHPSHTSHFITYENVTDGGAKLAERISELKRRSSHRHTKTGIELPDDLEERILPRAMVPKREKGV